MIKTIIKRNGQREQYIPAKLNAWGRWAASTIGNKVDWSSVVIDAVSQMPEEVTSAQLQEKLIQNCLDKGTWSYYLMAGRLYAAHIHKTIHPNGLVHIKELHDEMVQVGLMVHLDYNTLEYDEINSMLDHERDFSTPHFALHYIRQKYSLRDKVHHKEYETQQYVYMRMAMVLASQEKKHIRLKLVKDYYEAFSNKQMSAPTPNFSNLGTKKQGLISCNLYTVDDNEPSLAIGDHIAYRMTAASAGIGSHLNVRSKGDPIRGGSIEHQGKLPYYAALGKAVLANKQSSRGGSCTTYFSAFDPEAQVIAYLRNPRSTENRKNRDLHYAMQLNKVVARAALKNEELFSFNSFTAPDLSKAFFDGDIKVFEELYKKYEQDPDFKKEYFNARDLILTWFNEALETGVSYIANMDEINRHTPFKEPIHSSNLCVAPSTKILTKEGEFTIKDKAGKYVEIWNGEKWSVSLVEKTNENQRLLIVTLDNGKKLECTLYHKWYVKLVNLKNKEYIQEVRTYELFKGVRLEPYTLPDGTLESPVVVSIEPGSIDSDTYCLNEPERHRAVFNGILTGQCLEIAEPTRAYNKMTDLYSDKTVGYVKFSRMYGQPTTLNYNDKVKTIDGKVTWVGNIKEGDTFTHPDVDTPITVDKILESYPEPEVALCALGAIPYDHIDEDDDGTYYKVMYLSLKMIDYCIYNTTYPLTHIGVTAKARMNAGVGLMGLAPHMARKKLTYDSKEGLEEIHRVSERHMYFAIKASLAISKERGVAPWIHKTKWVDGWLPMDTANKEIEKLGDFKYRYDWETLRAEIIENGGIAHSCLNACMPGESSSKALNTTNSVYPVRDISLSKTDGGITINWAAPDSDDKDMLYQSAWDVNELDMIKVYAVMQKFTDQTISADLWRRVSKADRVPSSDLLNQYFTMVKYGMKTRYYYNSNVASGIKLSDQVENNLDIELTSNVNEGPDCDGCSM